MIVDGLDGTQLSTALVTAATHAAAKTNALATAARHVTAKAKQAIATLLVIELKPTFFV